MSDAINGLVNIITTISINGNSIPFPNSPIILNPTSSSSPIKNFGGSMGYADSITFSDLTSDNGDSNGGIPMVYGVKQNYIEGSPNPPCLEIPYPSMWRFKWTVKAGDRSISIKCKQSTNSSSSLRPSMVIKSNSLVGLMNDISGSAPSGTDWVTIGPVSFTPTANGCMSVELWNNLTMAQTSAFFDHIVTT
jgi:hypothetical protein